MMQALYHEEKYRPPFHDDGYPLYHFPAFCLLQLGKTEDAVDLLEESVDFYLAQTKYYNKKLSVDNPLLRENTYSYGFEGNAEFRLDRLKKGLLNPCFTVLAEHPRYTALVKRVEEILSGQ